MKINELLNSIRNFDSSPEDEMKRFILSLAIELRLDEGHALPLKVLMFRSFSLNPKQKDALVPALKKLIEEQIFEEKTDGNILLTAKGKDFIY